MAYNLKSMTPDSTFDPGSAFLFGADSQSSGSPSIYPASAVLSAVGTGTYISVADYGATGDNTTDDTAAIQAALDDAFGSSSANHGGSYWLNKAVWFPPGRYKITSPLTLTGIFGGIIQGSGRFVTTIYNANNTGVFVTNGCSGLAFRDMQLSQTGGTSSLFKLDWDNSPNGNALQSNTFHNIYFQGAGNGTDTGLSIGESGYMGSENLILNCFFCACGTGVFITNYNALMNTIIGGCIQSCGIGVHMNIGSMTSIHSVSFQLSGDCDIQGGSSAYDTCSIIGCRTESPNFVRSRYQTLHIDSCCQVAVGAGFFYQGGYTGRDTITNCSSATGSIDTSHYDVKIEHSAFSGANWINDSNATLHDVWGGVAHPFDTYDFTKYYQRGTFNRSGIYTSQPIHEQPVYNTVSGGSPLTLAAADMGARSDTTVNLTANLGANGTVTTDTATNIIALLDYWSGPNDLSYKLRIVNSSAGAHTWTLAGGTDVTVNGNSTIAQNTWNEYHVRATTSTTIELQYLGKGTF